MEIPKVTREGSLEKSETLEGLKAVGISLNNRFNAIENRTFDQMQEVKPNTWNENAGVIMFADAEGKIFAVPSTDRYREQLLADPNLTQDSSIGVPHLGVPEVWSKNPAEAGSVEGFQEWAAAVHQAEVLRGIEREGRTTEAGQENTGEPTLEELGEQYKV